MKKILIVCLFVVFLTACGTKEADNSENFNDNSQTTVKKECCIDNGGRWSENACIFDGYTETGTTDKEYYEKCVDARISTK